MKQKIPRSPFATSLSGSAKETELRLRSIFQWKKKRPPVILLLAALLLVAGCGGLIGFSGAASPEPVRPQIRMDVQYYGMREDSIDMLDMIEIPLLVMPDGEEANDGVNSINLALADLKEQYPSIPNYPDSYNQWVLYPTETERYINLLFYHKCFFTDLNTGHVTSLVYDKEEGRQVTLEDALALAGLTEQGLYDALSAQYDPQFAQEVPEARIVIQNHALEAFRMDGDGKPIFYLTARADDADDAVQDYVSGGDYLYIWSDGRFTIYEQGNIGMDRVLPLVPAEETVKLDPPLWCQWYFEDGEPAGGFITPENSPVMELTGNSEESDPPSVSLDTPVEENDDPGITPPEELTAAEAYLAVLQGNLEFRDTLSGGNFGISRVQEAITSDTSMTIKPDYFSTVDLDADGTAEVIVSLAVGEAGTGEYLVLRWQNGTVYGYQFAVREFSDVRTDGTFWNTGGASDVGMCTVTFDKDTYSIDRFTYSLYRPSDDSTVYFVDDQETTEEQWNLALSQWNEIPYVEWYEFTDANIEAVLS